MDKITLARLLQQWAAKQPGLRITPSGYMSWLKFVQTALHFGKQFLSDEGIPRSIGEALHGLASLDVPPRYVSESLLEAWMHTNTPTLTWNHPSVLPGYVLFFPFSLNPAVRRLKIEGDGDAELLAVMVFSEFGRLVGVPVTYANDVGEAHIHKGLAILPDQNYNANCSQAGGLIAKLVINSWYTHAFEPELITTDPIKSSGGTGFGRRAKETRSPIAPTWIGRDFKVQRLPSPATPNEARIPVRPHWRSGHWHTVRHGKGKEATRLQWYRPVYVNADSAA